MTSMFSWKSVTRAGTSMHEHPAFSIHTLYSGKYGATTMNSSSGFAKALMEIEIDAAAPTVI